MMLLLFLSFWLSCHSDAYPHIGIIRSEEEKNFDYEEEDDEVCLSEIDNLDVLLVLDNSCSMEPHQFELLQAMPSFVAYLEDSDLDYQIAVSTTSTIISQPVGDCSLYDVNNVPEIGTLAGEVITSSSLDAEEQFEVQIQQGSCGYYFERGLQSAWEIAKNNDELGVFRENSVYWVVFLSNENDYSIRPVWDYQRDIYEKLQPLSREHLRFSSIVIENIADCNSEILEVGGTKGSRYVALSEHSEGAIINLCKDNIYAKLKEEVDDFLKADICNCTSSSECRFGESCIEGECVIGCLRNSDCLGDEQCDFLTQQCEPRTCENTDLDCPTGDFCRSSQNACVEDSFDHCAICTSSDRDIDRSTYFEGGNLNSYCTEFHEGFFRLKVCSSQQNCPSGFGCVLDPFSAGDSDFGFCVGDCAGLGSSALE